MQIYVTTDLELTHSVTYRKRKKKRIEKKIKDSFQRTITRSTNNRNDEATSLEAKATGSKVALDYFQMRQSPVKSLQHQQGPHALLLQYNTPQCQ